MTHLTDSKIQLDVQNTTSGELSLKCPAWPAFFMENLRPALRCDQTSLALSSSTFQEEGDVGFTAQYMFADTCLLSLEFSMENVLRVRGTFRNASDKSLILNEVTLLENIGAVSFGMAAEQIRILEQSNYWGRIRGITEPADDLNATSPNEPNAELEEKKLSSDFVSVVYDRMSHKAFLAGFITSERWIGRITLATQPDGAISNWRMSFDAGDLQVNPGEEINLEELILAIGLDPWALLERYADEAAKLHPPQFPALVPVSWCSWYAYRLSMTEERILRNAEVGAQRLKALGLSIFELDLGWQSDNLPSTFEENERFPHGLQWLADELQRLGFSLGAWTAPFTISEFDPVSQEHPDWLVQDAEGNPTAYWEWYWVPHGKVFILDLTHSGAREWLRRKMESLYARGVRYLKTDFIGCVSDQRAKLRHDPHVVAGGALESARTGAAIIRDALPDALILNCGGPEMPGTGHWPLLYTCCDTGNTGFIGHKTQQENQQSVACHLFKNRRWGILQPSCLCVGLPGTLEDARIRATIAFMTGGQIDISDDLTTLPEDRWSVLTATLPPLGITAKPIDLFEPIYDGNPYDYSSVTKGMNQEQAPPKEHPAGSVWHIHVNADWDDWDLVGVFFFAEGASAKSPQISSFPIPLDRLGISDAEERTAYEFWSGHFVGSVPGGRANAGGYQHPGDFQELRVAGAPGVLEIAFFGPSVKLLSLRRRRSHPWVVGTSFHQSCGAELLDVKWDSQSATLRGTLRRPIGESGRITIVSNGMRAVHALVGGVPAPFVPGAQNSVVLPLTVTSESTSWAVEFEPET